MRFFATVLVAVAVCAVAAASAGEQPAAAAAVSADPFPIGERLVYKVTFMGIRCGTMTLESFREVEDERELCRIVMTARTTKFFDGIYRVRSRIESWFDPGAMSTIRYLDVSHEKKRVREERYELDLETGEVARFKDGEVTSFTTDVRPLLDPLAYLYRLRTLVGDGTQSVELNMVSSKEAFATVAEDRKTKTIGTPFGKREVLLVVPRPRDGMLFTKKGEMVMAVGRDDEGTLYRLAFDLSFGKLVAQLIEKGAHPESAGAAGANPASE